MATESINRESHMTHSSSQLPQPQPGEAPVANRMVVLSTPQEQALEWLIGGGSIAEAAQVAGVTRQTISRWLHGDPDFRAVYDAWKLETSALLEGRLIAAGEAAMDNILSAVRANGDVRASQFVIRTLLSQKKSPGT